MPKQVIMLLPSISEEHDEEKITLPNTSLIIEDEDPQLKSITYIGSIALLTNNLVGPSMMGLPNVFLQAGYVPSILCILYVWASSSICGTLLAETIASIPGNQKYTKNIEFSVAFHVFLGDTWSVLAESLFFMSCMTQAIASLVETAHTLDGFLGSFFFDYIYALQIWPNLQIVSWSSTACQMISTNANSTSNQILEVCTPFYPQGPLVITTGYILVTLLLFPLSIGHLREAMFVQILSFFLMLILLTQFCVDFASRGLKYNIPAFGPDQSELAGVVLFNFAYIVAVPSWLNEKANNVCINKVIWNSSTLSATMYIVFSLMAASAFQTVNTDVLTVLSSPEVHFITRFSAALFGIIIIGCGVPIYCIIMKNTLYACKATDKKTSFFFGAVFPFLISWALYQGKTLLNLLNYAGLIINGLVAFVLPLLLTLQATHLHKNNIISKHNKIQDLQSNILETEPLFNSSNGMSAIELGTYGSVISSDDAESTRNEEKWYRNEEKNENGNHRGLNTRDIIIATSRDCQEVDNFAKLEPLPPILEQHRTEIIIFIIASYIAIIVSTVATNSINFFD